MRGGGLTLCGAASCICREEGAPIHDGPCVPELPAGFSPLVLRHGNELAFFWVKDGQAEPDDGAAIQRMWEKHATEVASGMSASGPSGCEDMDAQEFEDSFRFYRVRVRAIAQLPPILPKVRAVTGRGQQALPTVRYDHFVMPALSAQRCLLNSAHSRASDEDGPSDAAQRASRRQEQLTESNLNKALARVEDPSGALRCVSRQRRQLEQPDLALASRPKRTCIRQESWAPPKRTYKKRRTQRSQQEFPDPENEGVAEDAPPGGWPTAASAGADEWNMAGRESRLHAASAATSAGSDEWGGAGSEEWDDEEAWNSLALDSSLRLDMEPSWAIGATLGIPSGFNTPERRRRDFPLCGADSYEASPMQLRVVRNSVGVGSIIETCFDDQWYRGRLVSFDPLNRYAARPCVRGAGSAQPAHP
jgi:hypothetical protein